MNNFVATIGIEVHTVVNSKLKMFSKAKSSHNDKPNTNVSPIDLAMPGVLPKINRTVVKKAICLAKLLNMTIDRKLQFDRKNYFYRDLPKGYQITQKFHPIGTNGYIDINVDGKVKRINIEDIHIEEDTAKQINDNGQILLDYNRCGMPLIEIVTKPDFENSKEVMAYIVQLKRILNFSNISNAKLEDGSLRADLNVSIRPIGQKEYGTRTEIKNVNSISNIGKAIDYEISRQESLLLQGKKLRIQTFRWDETLKQTVYMRDKDTQIDYHFFKEPNLLPFYLDDEFINSALLNMKYNYFEIVKNLKSLKYDKKVVETLLDDFDLFKTFNYVLQKTNEPNQTLTWILIELVGILKKDNKSINDISFAKIDEIIKMIELIKKGNINSKQAKTIIYEIYSSHSTVKQIIEKYGFKQITDPNVISNIVKKIIETNKPMVEQYTSRPERVEKFILGKVMQETKAQANPVVTMKIVKELLIK